MAAKHLWKRRKDRVLFPAGKIGKFNIFDDKNNKILKYHIMSGLNGNLIKEDI